MESLNMNFEWKFNGDLHQKINKNFDGKVSPSQSCAIKTFFL